VRAYVELLSGPLALVVNVTGASVVPVSGGLSRCAPLMTALDSAVRQQILRRSDRVLVVPSTLTEAGLIGAAYAFG
jgi:N-acetylglucosamine kinase